MQSDNGRLLLTPVFAGCCTTVRLERSEMKRNDTQNPNRGVSAAPRFFTIGDVANFLDVSARSVRRWIKSGDLPVHRFGGVVRILESDLRAFAATHREG